MFEVIAFLYIWYSVGVATTFIFEVLLWSLQIKAPQSIRRAHMSLLGVMASGVLGPLAAVPGVFKLYQVVGRRVGLYL